MAYTLINSQKLDLSKYFIDEMFLWNSKCILSGSYVLHSILNANWKVSDLDVYVKSSDFDLEQFDNFFIDEGYTKNVNSCKNEEYQNMNFFGYHRYYKTINGEVIVVEVMVVSIQPSFYIAEFFDLDIVKNYYDGTNTYSFNVLALIKHEEHVNIDKIRRMERITKYRNRGFDIYVYVVKNNNRYYIEE